MSKVMTNLEYSQTEEFKNKCSQFDIEPTQRQASKYRNKKDALHNAVTYGKKEAKIEN